MSTEITKADAKKIVEAVNKQKKKKSGNKENKVERREKYSTPTVLVTAEAIAKMKELNPERSKITDATINNMEKKLHALAVSTDKKFAANNFGANNFGANNFGATDYAELMSMFGRTVPCATLAETAHMIKRIITEDHPHPKLFGPRLRSTVMRTTCQSIYKVPASGSGGYTTGDTIIVVSPCYASYKGVLILSKKVNGTFMVLAYVSPDKNPELVCSQLAVLYTKLTVSSPLAVTGSNTAVAAQIMSEGAEVKIGPAALKAGGVYPMAPGRVCPVKVVGPEEHTIVNFTAGEDDRYVLRSNMCDPMNSSLVDFLNPASQSLDSSALGADPVAPAVFYCASRDATTATGAGFSSQCSAAWGSGAFSIPTSTVDLFNLSQCCDFNRALLFGDFEMIADFTITASSAGDVCNIFVLAYVDNGNGTTTPYPINQTTSTASLTSNVSINFSTRGATSFNVLRGKVIKNIAITLQAVSNPMLCIVTTQYVPKVRIRFLDIPLEAKNLVFVLSNIATGYPIAVGCKSHVEAFLAPEAINTTFLDCDEELPCDRNNLATVLRVHSLVSGHEEGNMSASSFSDTMNTILKHGGNVTRKLAGAGLLSADPALNLAAGVLGNAAYKKANKVKASSFGRLEDCYSYESYSDAYASSYEEIAVTYHDFITTTRDNSLFQTKIKSFGETIKDILSCSTFCKVNELESCYSEKSYSAVQATSHTKRMFNPPFPPKLKIKIDTDNVPYERWVNKLGYLAENWKPWNDETEAKPAINVVPSEDLQWSNNSEFVRDYYGRFHGILRRIGKCDEDCELFESLHFLDYSYISILDIPHLRVFVQAVVRVADYLKDLIEGASSDNFPAKEYTDKQKHGMINASIRVGNIFQWFIDRAHRMIGEKLSDENFQHSDIMLRTEKRKLVHLVLNIFILIRSITLGLIPSGTVEEVARVLKPLWPAWLAYLDDEYFDLPVPSIDELFAVTTEDDFSNVAATSFLDKLVLIAETAELTALTDRLRVITLEHLAVAVEEEKIAFLKTSLDQLLDINKHLIKSNRILAGIKYRAADGTLIDTTIDDDYVDARASSYGDIDELFNIKKTDKQPHLLKYNIPAVDFTSTPYDITHLYEYTQSNRLPQLLVENVLDGDVNPWITILHFRSKDVAGKVFKIMVRSYSKQKGKEAACRLALFTLGEIKASSSDSSTYRSFLNFSKISCTSFKPVNTGFFYPGVTGETGQEHYFGTIPVVGKGYVDPLIKKAFPDTDIGSPSLEITGRSGSLSQLLAVMYSLSFGSDFPKFTSGEVVNIETFFNDDDKLTCISFTILPVDSKTTKINDAIQDGLVLNGMFDEGWFDGKRFIQSPPVSNWFNKDYIISCKTTKPPAGYPGNAYSYTICKLKF